MGTTGVSGDKKTRQGKIGKEKREFNDQTSGLGKHKGVLPKPSRKTRDAKVKNAEKNVFPFEGFKLQNYTQTFPVISANINIAPQFFSENNSKKTNGKNNNKPADVKPIRVYGYPGIPGYPSGQRQKDPWKGNEKWGDQQPEPKAFSIQSSILSPSFGFNFKPRFNFQNLYNENTGEKPKPEFPDMWEPDGGRRGGVEGDWELWSEETWREVFGPKGDKKNPVDAQDANQQTRNIFAPKGLTIPSFQMTKANPQTPNGPSAIDLWNGKKIAQFETPVAQNSPIGGDHWADDETLRDNPINPPTTEPEMVDDESSTFDRTSLQKTFKFSSASPLSNLFFNEQTNLNDTIAESEVGNNGSYADHVRGKEQREEKRRRDLDAKNKPVDPTYNFSSTSQVSQNTETYWDQKQAALDANSASYDLNLGGITLPTSSLMKGGVAILESATNLATGVAKFVRDANPVAPGIYITKKITAASGLDAYKTDEQKKIEQMFEPITPQFENTLAMGQGLASLGWNNNPVAYANYIADKVQGKTTNLNSYAPNFGKTSAMIGAIYNHEVQPLIDRGQYARLAGHTIFQIASLVFGLKGADKVVRTTEVASLASKGTEIAQATTKLGRLGEGFASIGTNLGGKLSSVARFGHNVNAFVKAKTAAAFEKLATTGNEINVGFRNLFRTDDFFGPNYLGRTSTSSASSDVFSLAQKTEKTPDHILTMGVLNGGGDQPSKVGFFARLRNRLSSNPESAATPKPTFSQSLGQKLKDLKDFWSYFTNKENRAKFWNSIVDDATSTSNATKAPNSSPVYDIVRVPRDQKGIIIRRNERMIGQLEAMKSGVDSGSSTFREIDALIQKFKENNSNIAAISDSVPQAINHPSDLRRLFGWTTDYREEFEAIKSKIASLSKVADEANDTGIIFMDGPPNKGMPIILPPLNPDLLQRGYQDYERELKKRGW